MNPVLFSRGFLQGIGLAGALASRSRAKLLLAAATLLILVISVPGRGITGPISGGVTDQSHSAGPSSPATAASAAGGLTNSGVGDAPETAPPLATDLSAELETRAIQKALRRVGDWELARSRSYFSKDWTFAVLYAGFMAASDTLNDSKYRNAMLEMGKEYHWQLGPRLTHADDQAIGQTYLGLYFKYGEMSMIQPTQIQFEHLLKVPDDPANPVWWWCDALFMAPPVWVRLYKATHRIDYLDYMDREWWITSNLLYDPEEHLFSRDAKYLTRRQSNGKKVFWSRGNGWVMGGLVRVLEDMPNDYATRPEYVRLFRDMSAKIAQIQSPDGLWRTGLLDPADYSLPENSGSAFFVYALTWGIENGVLDRSTYLPVVKRAWQGLLRHVYSDGRLGSIQPVGEAPGHFQATSSYVYGVGAFLLAGSELNQWCLREIRKDTSSARQGVRRQSRELQ